MNVRTLMGLLVSLGVGFGIWFYLQNVPRSGVDDRPRSPLVVATRDLGAGAMLQALDLTIVQIPTEELPPDAVDDPAPLVGAVLSNVRFAGEAIHARHAGHARAPGAA